MKAEDKVIVVTGGGSGMGRELVLHLLDKGAKVIAIDINNAALQETAALAKNGTLTTFVTDITDRAAVEKLLSDSIAVYGHVDGIINNAGIIQPFLEINDLKYDAIQRVFNINFFGVLNMVKTFLPHLLTRPEAHIVNTSSMGGFLPVPGQTIYGASKAAVKLFTEGLYAELLDTNVKVTVVLPGAVRTHIKENSGLKDEHKEGDEDKKGSIKPMSPDAAAKVIIEGMENDRFHVFVGRDSRMLNRLFRLNPGYAVRMVAKKMKAHVKS